MNSVELISFEHTRGDMPEFPDPMKVALEAGEPLTSARSIVQAAWDIAEGFTGKMFYPVTSSTLVVRQHGCGLYRFPLQPFPATLSVEFLSGTAWSAYATPYIAATGEVELDGPGIYRLTAGPIIPATEIPNGLQQAVRQLAVYTLVHSPQRREFKSQGAGDTSLAREAVMGVLYGSGAGAMLTKHKVKA